MLSSEILSTTATSDVIEEEQFFKRQPRYEVLELPYSLSLGLWVYENGWPVLSLAVLSSH